VCRPGLPGPGGQAEPWDSMPSVLPHQLTARDDVSVHRALDILLRRTSRQSECGIERVQLEEVAMRGSGRRTGATVSDLLEVIAALMRARRQLSIGRNASR